jgi:hypothetical protein
MSAKAPIELINHASKACAELDAWSEVTHTAEARADLRIAQRKIGLEAYRLGLGYKQYRLGLAVALRECKAHDIDPMQSPQAMVYAFSIADELGRDDLNGLPKAYIRPHVYIDD